MKKSKREWKGFRIRTFNSLMIVISCVLYVFLLRATTYTMHNYEQLVQLTDDHMRLEAAARTVTKASDYLTEQVRMYVQTQDEQYAWRYFEEVAVTKNRENALEAAHNKTYNYVDYIHFYNDNAHKQTLLEQEIESEMEEALEERQFYVVVQPKYDPIAEKIVGGETLVRWQHPEKGTISPGVFINIFERDGFIAALDHFVWEETCRLQAALKQSGIKTVPISINVSRIHFYNRELRNTLREMIRKYGLESADTELEITESICGEDAENIFDIIRDLQSDGFRVAMDNFGSGYSSLNMLKEMPLDIIKMDLRFLGGEGNKSQLILKALIEMAQTMGLSVVVEGVELLSQVEFLRQFKNCCLQGYYYSRPVPTDVFETMLKEN